MKQLTRPTLEDFHFQIEGKSGTEINAGVYSEEYLRRLTGTQTFDIYDEMRRSDDQIKMLMRVVKNPIMSANWSIEPVDDSQEELDIAKLINHILFDDISNPLTKKRKTFSTFLTEALTCIEFGYSLFEVVHKIVVDDSQFGTYIGLKDLGWRSPKTIEEWNLHQDGAIENVRQLTQGDLQVDVHIPGKYLMVITPHQEGDNYEGISDLRNIYGNWSRKNFFRKLQMIGVERSATGVPTATIPTGKINTPEETYLRDMLSRFVQHQSDYIIAPAGYDIDSLKIEHDAEKVMKLVEQENIGMAKSFLANFMELGLSSTSSGSYALGSDISDIFLGGIEFYAKKIVEETNLKVIKELVTFNFGERDAHPTLKFAGINNKAGKEFAEILTMLTTNGLVQKSDRLKKHIHKNYNLPEFSEDEESSSLEPIPQPTTELTLSENDTSGKITKLANILATEMRRTLGVRSEKYIDEILKIVRNTPPSKMIDELIKLDIPGAQAYRSFLNAVFTDIVVDENNATSKKLINEEVSTPKSTTDQATTKAALVQNRQDNDIQTRVYFAFNQPVNSLTQDQLRKQLADLIGEYLGSGVIDTTAVNSVSSLTNIAQNGVYQDKKVFETIESFVFTNTNPKSPVCENLAGRVFTKAEYLTTTNLPPLHHNCKSFITPQQTTGKKIKPVDPIGLTFTGTPDQIEQIQNSKKF